MTDPIHPIGLAISQAAKAITRGFAACLQDAGGSLSTWLILQALTQENCMLQNALALTIGVQGPTMTHHLNSMETAGLITRTRLITDRRSHRVDITVVGQQLYDHLKQSAKDYDTALSSVLPASDLVHFRKMLATLAIAGKSPPKPFAPKAQS